MLQIFPEVSMRAPPIKVHSLKLNIWDARCMANWAKCSYNQQKLAINMTLVPIRFQYEFAMSPIFTYCPFKKTNKWNTSQLLRKGI